MQMIWTTVIWLLAAQSGTSAPLLAAGTPDLPNAAATQAAPAVQDGFPAPRGGLDGFQTPRGGRAGFQPPSSASAPGAKSGVDTSGASPLRSPGPSATGPPAPTGPSPGGYVNPPRIPEPPAVFTPPASAQPAASAASAAPAAAASPAATPVQSTASSAGNRRPLPPDMLAEALKLPAQSVINGRNFTLLEGLSTTMDRRRQAELTHAYWRSAQAIAEYHYAFNENAAIQQFQARPQDAVMLEAAKSSAAAALHGAEVAAVDAQADLAEAAMLPPSSALPLPADAPHVGPYRTYFDRLFTPGSAPTRARLIDRTLPISRRLIDVRASAVHAAEDALEAATDAYRQSALDFPAVLSAMGQLATQRRAMINAVCQYNHDIADYALSVAGPGIHGAALVSMLIRPSKPAQAAPNTSADLAPIPESPTGPVYEVQPASHEEPIPQTPRPASRPGQPTLAPPRPTTFPDASVAPSMPLESATPHEAGPSTSPASSAPADPFARGTQPGRATTPESTPPASGAPGKLPPPSGAVPLPPPPSSPAPQPQSPTSSAPARADIERPLVQVSGPPGLQTVRKPAVEPTSATQPSAALYPGLVEMAPATRAKQLADAMHWDRGAPEDPSQPIPLEECLKWASLSQRNQVLRCYWLTREKAGEYHLKRQASDFLEQLEPMAIEHRDPSGAIEMLRLRACKLAASAEQIDARRELLAAQFELTEMLKQPLDRPWLLPSTPPHAGPYLLKLEAQPPALAKSWPIRRLAAAVPGLASSLQERATAVVRADSTRAAALTAYQSGSGSIDRVLLGIRQQTDQSLAMLSTLTGYNQCIAEYALAVLPPGTAPDLLVKTLVIR